ncbi:MAG: transcription antitermination factor NusB [Patescibacteria group bacterium]|nr:transcription antitermination factor NusB [Patescibacteria group bacterium]MDE1988480.1 transcription antitermination factor NusB [Patescibacteria group bacterium]MDE2218272.1 transcription antitermination factor NusB [Patescibacteria group bacterium]
MANRHLARSTVLQSLYEWDFRSKTDSEMSEVITRNAEEFAGEARDLSFMKELAVNILEKRKDIDNIMTKAAPDWPLDKISIIDRNILRIGLYELIFADKNEVPAKVAINEAIELAKSYGGEKSGKFVNGVLGSVYREMGEPGKDEISKKKKNKIADVPFEKMPVEKLGGTIVFSKDSGEVYVALVHDVFGYWTLPKGHIKEEESETSGTERAVSEEIGIPISIKEMLGNNEYVASHPEKGKIRKQVIYYLAEAEFNPLKLDKSGGLDDANWFRLEDIINLNFYNDILPIVTKAIGLLVASEEKTSGHS